MKRQSKSRIALVVALTAALMALALGGFLVYCHLAARTPATPNRDGITGIFKPATETKDKNGFPEVDWDYWQSLNSDVIGWITIPGTQVDAPILGASKDAPDYYLSHDVYRNYNPHGAIFLDAECGKDLSSRNAVILGHHFSGDTAMTSFGVVADYKDKSFAEGHATILIQTPHSKTIHNVRFAQIVKGWEPNKRTGFTDETDFRQWYGESLKDAAMVLDSDSEPSKVVSLVSCSYNYWSWNERTVVVASPQKKD